MEFLVNWPWIEISFSSTVLLGVLLVVSLLSNQYPSARMLGTYLLSILLVLIFHIFPFPAELRWFSIVLFSFTYRLYVASFFSHSSRMSLQVTAPLVVGLAILLFTQLVPIESIVGQYIILGIFLVCTSLYSLSSIQIIKREGVSRGIIWMANPGKRLIWFRNFYLIHLILLLASFSLPYSSLITLIGLILANLVYVYHQIFVESGFFSPIQLGTKYQKSTLTAEQKFAILKRLDHLLTVEKIHLKDTISLSSLANSLNTTKHHLSQVINESMGTSFQELIAKHRIREAKHLIKDPDKKHLKIEQIATMVGYNSKSAFNSAFKKFSGTTPTAFRSQRDVLTDREAPLPERTRPLPGLRAFDLKHVSTIKIEGHMFTNFFKVFYRTLLRNKAFTAINLFGLVVGFTCSILIYLFVSDELSYDQDLPNSDDVYRISWINENPQTRTPHPMAQAMATDFPEVVSATSLSPWYGAGLSKQTIRVKNVKERIFYEEPDFFFVDSTFLDVFQLDVLAGDPDALRKPWNIVISDEIAKKYFAEQDPIGQELVVNNMPVEVAAVVQGMPEKSHFHFNALLSYVTTKSINPNNSWYTWADFGHFNYVKLKKGTNHRQVEAAIANWVIPYLGWGPDDSDDLKEGVDKFELQPIKDIHLTSNLRWELETNGNLLHVYLLIGTLIFVLLIVCINYVNLTTAKSVERAKEVGIRKTLGAFSGNLKIQFLLESFLLCCLSFVVAIFLSSLLLGNFNELLGKSFGIQNILNGGFIIKALLTLIAIALVSGIYPALSLTRVVPGEILKGQFISSFRGTHLRSSLVVVQFFVSSILILGTLIILKQIDYMKSKELGFDKDALISVRVHPSVEIGEIDLQAVANLQEQFLTVPGVKQTATASNLPGSQFNQHPLFVKEAPERRIDASEMFVDFDANDVLALELIAGRGFDKSFSQDSTGANILLNECAIRQLGLKEPVGETITWLNNDEVHDLKIVGVVKDFHYQSLHQPIQPLIILMSPKDINYVLVKMNGVRFQQTLSQLEKIYQSYDQEFPFEYQFLDQQLAALYQNEIRALNVFSIFASLALFLACLGLFGLAWALMNQKVKEVGIRKILGASSKQIFQMIVSQFAKLIAIALAIGLPIGYLLMNGWISEFPYQTSVGLMPFILTILMLLLVAFASISLVVLKISRTNPVDSLRYE